MSSDEQRAEAVDNVNKTGNLKTKTQQSLEDKIRCYKEKKRMLIEEAGYLEKLVQELSDIQATHLKEIGK